MSSSDKESTERSQTKNHSTVTKRKKRVQFLEDEDESIVNNSSSASTHQNISNNNKKAKLSHGESHRKEFLESVLFNSGGSSDEDDEDVDNQPILVSDSPFKDKHRHDSSTTASGNTNKDDQTTVDHYTRNILNRMDFSDSDDMDDFIEHDDSMATHNRTTNNNRRVLSSSVATNRNIQYANEADRTKHNADRSYRLALDVFGEDFIINNNSTQPQDEEYVSDDSERLFGDEDDSGQGDRNDYSQSTIYNRHNVVQKSIHELFEPEELKRQFLTNSDEIIRNKDIPERFQLRSNAVRPAEESELEKEAKWIYDNFLGTSPLLLTNDKRESGSSSLSALDTSKKSLAPYDHILYIKSALELIRNELCEVPFIHMYRHENINGVFTEDELWTIYKADNKWCSFSNKIDQFSAYLKRFQAYQQSPENLSINFYYKISDRDFQYLDSITSEMEFFHFYKKIQFYNGTHKNEFLAYEANLNLNLNLNQTSNSQSNTLSNNNNSNNSINSNNNNSNSNINNSNSNMNNPNSNNNNSNSNINNNSNSNINSNSNMNKSNSMNNNEIIAPQKEPRSFNRHFFYVSKEIDKVVQHFGLTAAQFDENVQMEYQKNNSICSSESPLIVAEKHLSSVFDTAEKVLEAAVDMYTLELGHEQHIRRYIHQLFLQHARLNVAPTKHGLEQIDESHSYCSFKYIVNKPIKGITSEMMLKLDQAKTEQLLEVTITLPEHIVSEMTDYLKSFTSTIHTSISTIHTSTSISINNTSSATNNTQLNLNNSNNINNSHNSQLNLSNESEYKKEWNELRCAAIDKAIIKYCLPAVERDIHQQLLREAHSDMVKRCGDVFKNHLIHPPFAAELKVSHSNSNNNLNIKSNLNNSTNDNDDNDDNDDDYDNDNYDEGKSDEDQPQKLILVISVPPSSYNSNNSYNYSNNGNNGNSGDNKRQPKYFQMKAVNGRINHSSLLGNQSNSRSYDDDLHGDNPEQLASSLTSTSLNSASNTNTNNNSAVGLTNDEIGYAVVMDDNGDCVDYVTISNAILRYKFTSTLLNSLNTSNTSNSNSNLNNNNNLNEKLKFAEASLTKIEKLLAKYNIIGVFIPLIDREYNYFAENFQNRLKSNNKSNKNKINVHLVNPYISDRMIKVLIKQDLNGAKKIEYQRAISIGRYALDPLVECANLFVNDAESLTFLSDLMAPYQRYLDVDKVRSALDEKLVSIVNEIGVDLNKASSVPWYANLVQFVCGFGARKAHRLLTDIRSSSESGRLNNRTQLITMCNLGPKIFINCAGFLKIEGFADEEGDVDLLDATRIHPELYDWTKKIMIDALDIEDSNQNDDNIIESIDLSKKYNYNDMLTNLRNNPLKLKELDLDVFADELMRQGEPLNKKYSLELITTEMLKEFPDYRPRFSALTAVEKFWILANGGNRVDLCETLEYSTVASSSKYSTNELTRFHNEDLLPLYVGKYVSFVATRFICKRPDQDEISKAVPEKDMDTQRWKCPFCFDHISTDLKLCWDHIEKVCPGNAVAVSGVLEGFYGTLTGVINLAHVSDNPPKNIKERVRKAMQITSVVNGIKFDRLSVDLTCRSSDLCDKQNNCLKFKRDAYYDVKAEEQQRQLKKEKKEQLKKQVIYQKKVIIHPSFKNITFTEAEKLLETAPIGDCIIRPSSKGSDHLTVTWKVYDGIYHHIDIIEKDKPNFFSLGKKLWIKGECYDDLDEIIARHIDPMSALMKEATTLKVFNYAEGGSRHKMASILSEEKKTNPLRIPYVFSPSKIYPGKLLLGFLPRNTPLFEYVSVVPEGVKFRDIIHPSFNDLVRWFKLNFNQSTLNSAYPNNASTMINKTPNAYHTLTMTKGDKSYNNNKSDGSISPLTGGGIGKKIGFNQNVQSTTTSALHNPSVVHGYTPTSTTSGGLSTKKSAP